MTENEAWRAFISRQEAALKGIREELAPYEAGMMRLSSRSGTGPWIDITADRIQRLKTDIAEIEALIAKYSGRAK